MASLDNRLKFNMTIHPLLSQNSSIEQGEGGGAYLRGGVLVN